jgi:hypothetical protein
MGKVTMKVFSDDRLIDRRNPRGADVQAPGKPAIGLEFTPETPEELHQTQALIQDLDKHFTMLRETLQERHTRITHVRRKLSELQIFLFPPRRRWWRRWLPW